MNKLLNVASLNDVVVQGGNLMYPRKALVYLGQLGDYQAGDLLDANAILLIVQEATEGGSSSGGADANMYTETGIVGPDDDFYISVQGDGNQLFLQNGGPVYIEATGIVQARGNAGVILTNDNGSNLEVADNVSITGNGNASMTGTNSLNLWAINQNASLGSISGNTNISAAKEIFLDGNDIKIGSSSKTTEMFLTCGDVMTLYGDTTVYLGSSNMSSGEGLFVSEGSITIQPAAMENGFYYIPQEFSDTEDPNLATPKKYVDSKIGVVPTVTELPSAATEGQLILLANNTTDPLLYARLNGKWWQLNSNTNIGGDN